MIKYKLIYIYVYFKPLYKLTKAFWASFMYRLARKKVADFPRS